MDQARNFVQGNWSMITSIVWIIVIFIVLYVLYNYMYPGADENHTQFITSDMDARKPMPINGRVPHIFTGGDFTLSMWIYIDDWNYRATNNKLLFALSPDPGGNASSSPLVGVLTPLQNGLMVRANTVTTNTSMTAPNINSEKALKDLMYTQTSTQMHGTTIMDTPCDIKEVPLQKWVNITIVSSGRVLDVYMDGKLTRSCVLDNVVNVPTGKLRIRLGDFGGFGGRYSSVQMWNYQLTPDVIYSVYQMGPSQTQHDIFTDLAKWLGVNVSFTKSSGTPTAQATCSGTPAFVNSLGNAFSTGGLAGVVGELGSEANNAATRFQTQMNAYM